MKITEQAVAYLKSSPSENGRSVVRLSSPDSPIVRPYLGCLQVCYVVDDNQSYTYIQNRHIDEDKISADELHQIGLRNLKELFSERNSKVQTYGNIFPFIAGGDFEASVMLLDGFWDNEFRKFVKGEYAVAIPARDVLAFCDADSTQGIAELKQLINRIWPTGDHLVSDKIFARQQDKWKVL